MGEKREEIAFEGCELTGEMWSKIKEERSMRELNLAGNSMIMVFNYSLSSTLFISCQCHFHSLSSIYAWYHVLADWELST